ncbi:MAG: hypothetical protein KGJ38_08265 [Burkholderiaceae bacterium]|nr:hypothetical protein [Burkholderiaceae bacterium]
MSHYIKPLLAFLFVCACGLFVGWIGGVAPFTTGAGLLASSTIFFGIVAAIAAGDWE